MGPPLSWINLPVMTALLLALQQRLEAWVVAQGVVDRVEAQTARLVISPRFMSKPWTS